MVLKVLGSGSSGNTYLLENETECLVIEAGLPFMEVKKAIDFQTRKIVGVIAGHAHLDHSGRLGDYDGSGIPIFRPYEKFEKTVAYGNFKIYPFELLHNVPCYGFYITHPDMGILVYASDTEYIKWKFANVNHFLVECNYDMKYVDRSLPNYSHILSGHLSLDTCKEFLRVNNSTNIRNVVLCHLSSSNSDSNEFREEISKVVDCDVKIAKKGLTVNLDLVPF